MFKTPLLPFALLALVWPGLAQTASGLPEEAREGEQTARNHAARDHEDRDREDRDHADRDHKGKPGEKGREHAASRGEKRGWVDGMPPGQAKKQGGHPGNKGRDRDDDHDHDDHDDGKDRDRRPSEEVSDTQPAEGETDPTAEQPASAEDILRDMAKDKTRRATGVAPGSAEEELVEMGTDAILDKAKR